MGVGDHVGGARIAGRGFDAADRAPLGQAGDVLGDVVPGLAAVLRDVDQAVVAAGPQYARLLWRFRDGEDGAVDLDAGVVACDRSARPFLLRLIVARQIGADRGPGLAFVLGSEENISPVIDRSRIVWGN